MREGEGGKGRREVEGESMCVSGRDGCVHLWGSKCEIGQALVDGLVFVCGWNVGMAPCFVTDAVHETLT